jgi:IclR family pca regulon transcriptional regulator
MTSLARGLEVIHAFQDAAGGRTMSEISARTGLSRAVVRRCLYTLQELGYVRAKRDTFQLEPKVLSLGCNYISSSSLPEASQPFLDELSRTTQETCSVGMLDGSDVVFVARAEVRRIMTVSMMVGGRLPWVCSSMGRVLLANLDSEQLASNLAEADLVAHTAHTAHTVKSKQELEDLLARTRQDGYSLVNEELEDGLRTLAAPVFGRSGSVVAAMSIGVPTARISQEQLLEHLPILKETASHLGAQVS